MAVRVPSTDHDPRREPDSLEDEEDSRERITALPPAPISEQSAAVEKVVHDTAFLARRKLPTINEETTQLLEIPLAEIRLHPIPEPLKLLFERSKPYSSKIFHQWLMKLRISDAAAWGKLMALTINWLKRMGKNLFFLDEEDEDRFTLGWQYIPTNSLTSDYNVLLQREEEGRQEPRKVSLYNILSAIDDALEYQKLANPAQ